MSTFAEAVRRCARTLEQAGWPPADAARDAEVLARSVLGWDAGAWLARSRDAAPAGFRAALDAAVARRLRHEPVAYITGEREFYGRPFGVSPAVLVPRPETEVVVDEALRLIDARAPNAPPAIVDVGTGSGCLAVTLVLERPAVTATATDVSNEALAVAVRNARALDAIGRLRFVRTSIVDALAPPFDLVVSNPPYVAARDRASLPTDVRDYEPALALFGGEDGFEAIRELVRAAARMLRPGGSLVMEIGAGQAPEAEGLAHAAGLVVERVAPDLAGIPRVLVAHRPPAG